MSAAALDRVAWLPGRWLAPLMLAVFALATSALNYGVQLRALHAEVLDLESQRLRERLAVEQSRLSFLTEGQQPQQVRRIVSSLALVPGIESVWLLRPDGMVTASLVRADIGRGWDAVVAEQSDLAGDLLRLPPGGPGEMAIAVRPAAGGTRLMGVVPFATGRRLVAVTDLAFAVAQRRASLVEEVVRESLILLALVGVMALIAHGVWFRRAQRLQRTLARVGDGDLTARTGLGGRDEIGRIAAEADRMAGRLQTQQTELRRLQSVVDRSPLVVIQWRNAPGWPVIYVSESVRQWGFEPAALLQGRVPFGDLIHPDDLARVEGEVSRFFADGTNDYRQEYRLRTADGRWVWVDDRTSLDRDASGEVLTISGILLDITAQKEALLAQREQAELLERFYDLPFIGMAISDPHSRRWLQVNDRLCEILGYPREELLGKTWSEMTPSPDLALNLSLLEQVRSGERDHYQMHKRFVRKDGAVVDTEIDVRAVRGPGGELLRLLSTVQDVTERRRASEALRDQRDQLVRAESMAGLGSWRFDLGTQSIWWSDQLFRNFDRDLALGPPPRLDDFIALLHPEDQPAVAQFMRAHPGRGAAPSIEYRRHPDLGPPRWFRASVQSHRTAPDGPSYFTGTVLDITALKEAQQALERSNAELEARVAQRTAELSALNSELEAFSYTVSHDLKAPLRGIDGYSQLLAEDFGEQLGEAGRGYLDRIRRGVQQMASLINDLLDYSRMERRSMDAQAVEVVPLLRRVTDELAADIERTGASLVLTVPADCVLQADREGLAVVLRNLVGNALKFSARGQAPRVEIGADRGDGCQRLWVRDNGVGFDMKYHDRIFGIFQRLHRAEEVAGTGVGLALVAKAVQRMGGRVWAQSQPGHGATFFVEFPS